MLLGELDLNWVGGVPMSHVGFKKYPCHMSLSMGSLNVLCV